MTMSFEEAKAYAAELREIAGMVAQTPDGPLRWKQYRLAAVADYLDALFRAEERTRMLEALHGQSPLLEA